MANSPTARPAPPLAWGPPPYPAPPSAKARGTDFTTTMQIAWTTGVPLRDGRVTIGGSPFLVTAIPDAFLPFAQRLHAAGRSGITPDTPQEQAAAVFLLDRGIADPLPPQQAPTPDDVAVVVPVYNDAEPLEACLASLQEQGLPVTVVDDASPEPQAAQIAQTAQRYGARLIVQQENTGPGGARTTGFEAVDAPFVAFLDADVIASPGWVARLRAIFDDPAVGAVGPRVLPDVHGDSAIELYEETRSELDMGAAPSRVVYGVPTGWLPSASVIVRRAAVTDPPFEPGLRVGEDVDLFWRMHEAGWTVRFVTDVVNHHGVRNSWKEFSSRRTMYGSSAANLEYRHPTHLIPAQPSASGLSTLAALATHHPLAAAGIATYELARQRRILPADVPTSVAVEMTGRSLFSDAFWMGHLLRRDWWPVGWSVLATAALTTALPTTRHSTGARLARGVVAAMMWEPVKDHVFSPTRLNPLKALPMRLLDDASYGSGVIGNAIRKKVPNVVLPRVRIPWWPKGQ